MATRKSTLKATITEQPFVETVAPESVATEESKIEDLTAAFEACFGTAKMPSIKRLLIAFVLTIAVSLGAGYLIGFVLEYLVIGALMLTGSAFLGIMIYIFGIFFGMYAGGKIGGFIYNSVVNERIDAAYGKAKDYTLGYYQSARDSVTSLFSSKKVCAS